MLNRNRFIPGLENFNLESRYTPSSLRRAYTFDKLPYDGSGQTIAVIVPYRSPYVINDVQIFSQQDNLPLANIQEKWITKKPPITLNFATDSGGWIDETASDVEYAHGMAPGAKVLLMEAASPSLDDLARAAAAAARQPGVTVVSMSWGGDEFKGENAYDKYFAQPKNHPGVTFVIAAGDNGGFAGYPAVSPNILTIGGTNLTTDENGNYIGESVWPGTPSGPAKYEPNNQIHQIPIFSVVAQGVEVYSTPENGFVAFDGTSLSTPIAADTFILANQGREIIGKKSLTVVQDISLLHNAPKDCWHKVSAGFYTGSPGYGSPIEVNLVNYLVHH